MQKQQFSLNYTPKGKQQLREAARVQRFLRVLETLDHPYRVPNNPTAWHNLTHQSIRKPF